MHRNRCKGGKGGFRSYWRPTIENRSVFNDVGGVCAYSSPCVETQELKAWAAISHGTASVDATGTGAGMASLVQSVRGELAQRSPTVARETTIKSWFADAWPQMLIAVGLFLSVAWSAGLVWILLVII